MTDIIEIIRARPGNQRTGAASHPSVELQQQPVGQFSEWYPGSHVQQAAGTPVNMSAPVSDVVGSALSYLNDSAISYLNM